MNKGCLIAVVALLVLLTAGLGYYFSNQGKEKATKFETTTPEVNDVISKAVATGSIKPRLEVNIKPQVSGVVDQLYVEAGEIVEKGQRLARIKLIPSEVNVNSAQSNVDLARIRVQEARRELTRQQAVFGEQLDVKEAKRNLDNAIEESTRQQQLFEDGIISEQEYQRFVLDRDIRQNAYDNALLQSKNSLGQFEAQLEIREQELQAAINNLQLLREGVTQNSKQVSNVVVSTVAGMILDVPLEEGSSVIERNNFNEGTNIAVIADMSNIIFEGKVDESDVGKLQEGMELELTVGAIPEEKFQAVLEFISPQGVEEEGTVKFEIKAAIKPYESDVFLRAGYSANGDVIIDKREQVITVYERDVTYKDDKAYLNKVTGDRETDEIEVQLGLSDGLIVEVESGIDTSTSIQVMLDPNAG
ncbi:MAG: HlyD family efflux transporter periplasmic adaptor subunit [Bacteroidota bacterium]